MAWLDRRSERGRPRAPALRSVRDDAVAAHVPEVFVVEADRSVRVSLVWLLDSLGIGALAFASTAEFLRGVQASHGCVIVDVELRGVNKLVDFAGELRRRGLALPIVATSADPFVSAEEIHRAGAIAFLPKPFASDALLDCLRQAALRSSALAS